MNNFNKIRSLFSSIDTNMVGKKIKEKVIVFESDDWGSIRTPSVEALNVLSNFNIPVNRSAYCMFDGIETTSDIEGLLTVFSEIEHRFGKKPVFTMNFVSANPDFLSIKSSKFKKYYYEPFTKTYERYSKTEGLLNLIFEGISENYFVPAFHGRDHVNVPLWLELLQKNKHYQIAFDNEMWGLSKDVFPNMDVNIQATYDSNDSIYVVESLNEGLKLFKEVFQFPAKSFIANNYIWSDLCTAVLKSNGVKIIQSMKYQLLPFANGFRSKRRRHFGYNTETDFYYSIRNCYFEPTEVGTEVSDVLWQINNAFMFGKPAVISTHRINYSSRISENNRNNNLKKLKELLTAIICKWPDVSFESSDGILKFINEG